MEWAIAFTMIAAGIGAGIAALAAGFGISRLAASAVESMARQPEASGSISGAMIISAAFIEGVCLFAALICLLISLKVDASVFKAVGH
jgi:F-type H+-transporting ATPase subunit c